MCDCTKGKLCFIFLQVINSTNKQTYFWGNYSANFHLASPG